MSIDRRDDAIPADEVSDAMLGTCGEAECDASTGDSKRGEGKEDGDDPQVRRIRFRSGRLEWRRRVRGGRFRLITC